MIKTININDKQIRYGQIGNGRKSFIMLPGVFLTSIVDSVDNVEKAYSMFLDEYTIYLFDYKFIEEGYTIEDFADYFISVFEKLNLNSLYIFGVSMGGTIGQIIALKRKDLVHKLILASSFCRMNPYLQKVFDNWVELARQEKIRELNYDLYNRCFTKDYIDSYKDIMVSVYNNGTPKDCVDFIYTIDSMCKYEAHFENDNIECETLVIGSKNDLVLGPDANYELIKEIGCDSYMYDYYSHAVYDEAPDYKQRIYNFFKD